MTDAKRIDGADFLRAVACLAVLFHHLAFRIKLEDVPEALAPLVQFLKMGSFGVAIFFVLSGYLLARPFWWALDRGESMPSMRVYWLRRLARIVPGFWVALTASLLIDLWLGGAVLDGQRMLRYVAGMFLVGDWHWVTLFPVDINGPLWSIGFEVSSYALLPLCLAGLFVFGSKGWPARLGWLGIIALTLVIHALIVAYLPIDDVNRGWDHGIVGGAKAWVPRYNPIGFFAIFAIGALAAGVQTMIAARHRVNDVIGVLAIVAAGAIMAQYMATGMTDGYSFLGIPYGFPLMPLAIGVALVALASSISVGRWLDSAPVRFIARISFGIYVWHMLIIWLAPKVVPGAFQTADAGGWYNWLWSSAGVVAASIAIATLSFYLIEQPAVRWARRFEHRTVAGRPALA